MPPLKCAASSIVSENVVYVEAIRSAAMAMRMIAHVLVYLLPAESAGKESFSMRRFAVLLIVLMFACKEKPQPAESNTIGNATDRNPANGTSGTGTPAPLSTGTVSAATGMATAPTTGTNAIAVTGTEVVHGAKTETTSTIVAPTTTTAAVETPTDTSATVQTMTGAKTTQKKKKP